MHLVGCKLIYFVNSINKIFAGIGEKVSTNTKKAFLSFSRPEKAIFLSLSGIFIISLFFLLDFAADKYMVKVPAQGGSISEGIIGTPRFINPILAMSDSDKDMTNLIYSGLLRESESNGYITDLAEKYTISPDGLTYTFVLKDNLYFHDGTPLTADDVEFTVNMAKDQILKSPKRLNWEGVSVQRIDDKTVTFTLKQQYAPFLENTTLGIIPKHIWKNISAEQWSFSDFNLNGIGSGPYKISKIKKNTSGIPEYYELSSFKKFALGRPHISEVIIKVYSNEKDVLKAFNAGEIDNISAVSPDNTKSLSGNYTIKTSPLPRIFGVFFNQNQASVLTDVSVRRALDVAIDRNRITNNVLYGYAIPIKSPLPNSPSNYLANDNENRVEDAKKILTDNGWKYDDKEGLMIKKNKKETLRLQLSISTASIPELRSSAELVKEDWEKIGAKVEVKIFDKGDLEQNVIRPRKYEALLFGEIVGHDSDPFAFWHSSQRNDPGLNIAMYTNSKADKILEEARAIFDEDKRSEKYRLFEKEVANDIPATFIYSPEFIYAISKNVQGVNIERITGASERFTEIYKWYIETDRIWKAFIK